MDVEKPGRKKGYKQTPEHIEKRKRWGDKHHAWQGDEVSERGGRARALRQYGKQPCSSCAIPDAERHHIDGNTANNEPSNIAFLCRRCHMLQDGRLEAFSELARTNQPKALRARWASLEGGER